MSLFDTIKYQITDIYDNEQLDQLPGALVSKWRRRVEDYGIEKAKSVVHLDTSGVAQKAIDAIYLYRDGKITQDELSSTADRAARASYVSYDAAADAATYAAYASYAGPAADAAAVAADAAYAAANAAADYQQLAVDAWNIARTQAKDLFTQWLREEIYKYEEQV